MQSGIEYFKSIYTDLPQWVEIMHKYSPEMLTLYTAFRAEGFRDSEVLSALEKDELIAAFNAGRLYKRSMILHTQGAINKGSKLEDSVEYMLIAAYYSRKEALECGLFGLREYIHAKHEGANLVIKNDYRDILEVVNQIYSWMEEYDYDTNFIGKVKKGLEEGKELRDLVFEEGHVTSQKKYLAYAGMFITELDGQNAREAINMAKNNGVTDEELAEMGYVILFTSGIPSWFEISDYLE